MIESTQRTANRSALLAVGLLLVFFAIAALGDWEGMIGLALGLMLYFVALLHVPLGIVALVAAFKSGNHRRNSWIYLYFGGFTLAALIYLAAMGEWGEHLSQGIERLADPDSVSLRDALRRFDADSTKALAALDAGADIETRDDQGRTPLMLAANAGFEDVVERLLSDGANPDAIADDGANALHFAAAGGMYRHSDPSKFNVKPSVVNRLLAAGVDADAVARDGVTPIIGACTAGSVKVVSALLAAGADISVTPKHGRDCLASAVRSHQLAFVRWLITESQAGFEPGRALSQALYRRDAEMFALLLELGGDPANLAQSGGSRSLALRLAKDEPPMPEMRAALIATGQAHRAFADGGAAELREAVGRTHDPHMLDALLAMGVKPDAAGESGDTALHRLAGRNRGEQGISAARRLLAAGASTEVRNRNGKTPLGIAAAEGRLDMLNFLINNGANVNDTDEKGNTPLMLAARGGYGYIIEALRAGGAELPPEPLHVEYFRASRKHAPGIRSLIATGFNPNAIGEHGFLPLFALINYGTREALAALLEGGAKLDVRESRYTPLTAAIDEGNDGAVNLLLEAGVDPNANDGKGRTPLDLAIRRRSIPITIALIRDGVPVTELQRRRIEHSMLSEKYRGGAKDRKPELRGLL